jgi:hypothetical protein
MIGVRRRTSMIGCSRLRNLRNLLQGTGGLHESELAVFAVDFGKSRESGAVDLVEAHGCPGTVGSLGGGVAAVGGRRGVGDRSGGGGGGSAGGVRRERRSGRTGGPQGTGANGW